MRALQNKLVLLWAVSN